jgi:competence protein ComEC
MFLTAELLGRQRSTMTALAFAAAVMLGVSPKTLWDASFQMSFAAMAGLVFLAPSLMAGGRKMLGAALGEGSPAAFAASLVTDTFSVTAAAVIAVSPLIAHYFGIVSLVSLPATALALPALPGIIVTGALTGVVGLVALPLAQVVGWLAWPFASYLLLVVNGFAAIPLSSVTLAPLSAAAIWGYYTVLALLVWLISYRRRSVSLARAGMNRAANLMTRLPRRWLIPTSLLMIAVICCRSP